MKEYLDIIVLLFAIIGIGGFYGVYEKFLKPKRKKTKLKVLSGMIEQWFDTLDINLEKGLNVAELNNQERKILDYIDNELAHYFIKPNKKTIRKWNKKMGIKEELLNSAEIFQKFSRIPATGIYLDMFFWMITANFYKFHSAYNSNNKGQINFADVEMPINFFKFYVRNL